MSIQFLSRKELYDLVWSKPMTQLSKDYGLSDNGLRKICIKYDIPIPQAGYWSKLKHGKKVNQTKLGHFDKWGNTKISLKESEASEQEHYITKLNRRAKEIAEECHQLLPVLEKLSNPHPFVQSAKSYLKDIKNPRSWRNLPECVSTERGMLAISVQKHNVPRALRIMNTFIKMAEKRGHGIFLDKEATIIQVYGKTYNFRLREKHTRQLIKDGTWERNELIPIDKLIFKHEYYIPKEWVDGTAILEGKLTQILAYFELSSVQAAKDDEQYRIRQAESDRLREIEQKLQAQREWEYSKQTLLQTYAQEWQKSNNLRQFIATIESQKDSSQKTKGWLNWANQIADQLDPLSDGVEELIAKFDMPGELKVE